MGLPGEGRPELGKGFRKLIVAAAAACIYICIYIFFYIYIYIYIYICDGLALD